MVRGRKKENHLGDAELGRKKQTIPTEHGTHKDRQSSKSHKLQEATPLAAMIGTKNAHAKSEGGESNQRLKNSNYGAALVARRVGESIASGRSTPLPQ
jgi:hypothetical protein